MSSSRFLRHGLVPALVLSTLFAISPPAHAGGQRGVAHVGGFGFHGGPGAFRGGYYRGGYGWRGGWYGRYGYGGWGWGGLGYGLFVASLPFYYSTYWWGGVPYYYADDVYYRWNANAGSYETVAPPQGSDGTAPQIAPNVDRLFAYPKNGQTADQQSRDESECHDWAQKQTGFDPAQPGAAGAAGGNLKRSNYFRAETACLEGRGYSVK